MKTCKGDDESKQLTLLSRYARLKANTRRTRLSLDSLNLPKHRAIEIQTSDAGLGVSTKEKLAQIRLAEAFQIHNLDLQGRLHYAPGDSRVHIAGKVMRSLNEHAGAGHTISIPSVLLTSLFSPGDLMAMSKNEVKDLTDRKEKQEAEGCSESVASLYMMESPVWELQFMREYSTFAFVMAFSLITNICSNVTQGRLNLPKHSMHVLEVHTSNISKSFLRTTIVYVMGVWKEFEMLVKAMDKNVIFMHTFRIPQS